MTNPFIRRGEKSTALLGYISYPTVPDSFQQMWLGLYTSMCNEECSFGVTGNGFIVNVAPVQDKVDECIM